MIRLKTEVRVKGLRPEMALAISVAEGVWAENGAPELVITSANDGKHKSGSLHYSFLAVDFRTHNLSSTLREKACDELRERLGVDYDVVFESRGTPVEHCHVEFDPK